MAGAPRPMERPPIAQHIVIAKDPVTIHYIRLCDVKGSRKLLPMTPAIPLSGTIDFLSSFVLSRAREQQSLTY
jgi:hypothetical protein